MKTVHQGSHDLDRDELLPQPAALLASLRGIGYSFEDAVCDIIDNSISAGATCISVFINLSEQESIIVDIADDGRGLDENTLRVALTLGAKDRAPDVYRASDDLGRFGLGLKTASFAMATRMSLYTRHASFTGGKAWDLKSVADSGRWKVENLGESEAVEMAGRLGGFASGTVVRWSNIDRLPAQLGRNKTASLQRLVEALRHHLGLIYHRFIEGLDAEGAPRKVVRFIVNSRDVAPWNPLAPFPDNPELVDLGEVRHATGVRAEYAILPPDALLTAEQKRQACLPGRRLADMQGFYVYRADRLVCFGTWLGLPGGSDGRWSREPSTQLARVSVDLTNSADDDWSLDVRKSKVTPPERDRLTLKEIGAEARARSRQRIFGRLGKRDPRTTGAIALPPLWVMDEGLLRINRSHPLVSAVVAASPPTARSAFMSLMRQLEDSPALIAMVTEHRSSTAQSPAPNVIDDTDFEEVAALAGTLSRGGADIATILEVVGADSRFSSTEIRDRLVKKLTGGR